VSSPMIFPLVKVIVGSYAHTLSFSKMSAEFYLRYYVGHKGKFGHEFLEFEFRPDGEYVYYVSR